MKTETGTTKTGRTESAAATSTPTDPLDGLTLREILGIPSAAMDQAMGIAYQLYVTGRLAEAETVCRGLIACDHEYWWSHSLYASVLRRLGRHEEALAAVELGLRYEPRQAKLTLMRAELLITVARKGAPVGAPVDSATARRNNSDLRPAAAAAI